MGTELTIEQRVNRLEDTLKANIDGLGLMRHGQMTGPGPRDVADQLLDFSDDITAERRDS